MYIVFIFYTIPLQNCELNISFSAYSVFFLYKSNLVQRFYWGYLWSSLFICLHYLPLYNLMLIFFRYPSISIRNRGQWNSIFGQDYQGGKDYPLWYPHFNRIPTYSDWYSFGGWERPNIKQYEGLSPLCGVDVDVDWADPSQVY